MKEEKLEIRLTPKPDMLGFKACQVHVQVVGDCHTLAQCFALALTQNPVLLNVVMEAIINLDNVQPVTNAKDN